MIDDDISLKDTVHMHLIGEEAKGFVDAILYSFDGIQYRVVYWHEAIRRVEWCYRHEFVKLTIKNGIKYSA